MITRPPIAALGVAAALAVLTLVPAIMLTPNSYPDGSRDRASRFWWARLTPRPYAIFALRTSPYWVVAAYPPYCPAPENDFGAWLTLVASRQADSIFRHLFAQGSPVTRLYALAGLFQIRSRAFAPALSAARYDTSKVRLVVWPDAPHDTLVQLASLASVHQIRSWLAVFGPGSQGRCAA
jgi:hypothetical protein